MARVPVYNQQQVAARAAPLPMQQRISTSVPDGTQAFARGIGQAGEALAREAAYDEQMRVEDAVNQLRERQLDLTLGQQNGFMNVKGRNALPADGMSLSDRYTQQFKGVADEIESTLSSDRQKALFRRYATRAGTEFRGGLMRHENAEIDGWRKGVVDGVISVEAENAAKNWNNPEAISLSRSRIDINLSRIRDAEGIPADQLEKMRNEAMTRLHTGVINQMIGNRQLDAANAYLKQYGSEINADKALQARQLLEKETDAQYALGAADRVFKNIAPSLDPDSYTRLTNLVFDKESRGRQFNADGSVVTSPKGAVGIAQVMPGTGPEAAKLAGLQWDEKRFRSDPEYNAALGSAYLNAQLKKYGGDVALALAAYNAGPGATDGAIAKAEKAGKPEDWLSYLPKETREYVPAILAKFQAGAGAPKKPTFAEADEKLRADPYLSARPAAYKAARETLKQRFEDQEKAAKQRQDEAEGEVYRQIVANGGDFYALPAALRAQVDPTKLDSAMAFAAKIRKGEEIVTNPALYQRLATDPGLLRNMSDGEFYALHKELSTSDFKHFTNERAKALGKAVTSGDDLNSEAVNRTLNVRLQTMGLDPTPKDGTSGAARVGAIRQFVTRSILDAQKAAGKKLNDAEVVQEIDRLFAQSTQLRGFFGGTSNVAMLSMKPSDVPSEARDQIKAAFKAAGQPEPSDVDILQVYWANRFNQSRSTLSRARAPQPQATSTPNQAMPPR